MITSGGLKVPIAIEDIGFFRSLLGYKVIVKATVITFKRFSFCPDLILPGGTQNKGKNQENRRTGEETIARQKREKTTKNPRGMSSIT